MHILLQNCSVLQRPSNESEPVGFIYNKHQGLWVHETNGSLYIDHPEFSAKGTKKFDVETGEDHKG